MFDALVQVLTKPAAFFRSMRDDDRVASRAFWVVLIVAMLGAVYSYFSALPSADAMQNTGFGSSFSLVIAPVGALFASFIFWLIYGLLVRIPAGMEAKPWAVTAYGMAPQILIYAVLIVVAALFPPELTPVTAALSDTEAFQEQSFALQREFQNSLLGRTSTILTYVSSLWWIVLIFIGVRELVGQNKAVTAAALTGIVTLVFAAIPFLLSPVS
jgi:hypothetical protein